MNKFKKIIALITVIFVVIRVYVFSVSASFAAPFIAEETLKTVLIEGMLAGGSDYTKDDLEAWELDDLKNEFEIQMNTNSDFKPQNVIPPFFNIFDLSDPGPGYNEDAEAFDKMANQLFSDWFNDMVKNETLQDKIYFTPAVDLEGNGALGVYKGENDWYNYTRYVYGDYGIVNFYPNGRNVWERNSMSSNDSPSCYVIDYIYNKDGSLFRVDKYFVDDYRDHADYTQIGFSVSTITSVNYYGDWRYADDTPAETDDVSIPVIGDADGTQVTPDMLNPDGTVTIGDTTYYPKDFIDWNKFKDPAIIDLLNDILTALENIPVVDDSKTDIGEVDSDVTLPSELSDFATPGLINVFPFCLPYDFIRGMRLFSAEPEIPHFEEEITIPAFLNVPEQKWKFEIDFKEMEPLAKITRWTSLISFIYVLILITPKIAKGA